MASSELAGTSGSGSPRFIDLLRSFSSQARLALGTRGVIWASVAGVVGILSCLVAFADIGLSIHRSDVDPQRRLAREVTGLDNASRQLMRELLASASSTQPPNPAPYPPARPATRTADVPWMNFTGALERLCGDFDVPAETKLAVTCGMQSYFLKRVGMEIDAADVERRPLAPPILRELLTLRDDISELSLKTTRTADDTISGLVDDYTTALAVLTISTIGFMTAGFVLVLLVGRASMDYHAQWQRAVAAAGDAGAARDLLSEVIDALPAGIVVYDADERLRLFNSVARSLTPALREPGVIGWTYEQLARDSAKRLDDAGVEHRPVEEWIERFRNKTPERQWLAEDGRWYDWSEKGTASGLTVGVRVDVTDIKQNELALEKARAEQEHQSARYQSLVDSLSDMVYAIDARGRFTYVSPGAADLLGVPTWTLIGTLFKDWVVPDDIDQVMKAGREFHRSPSRVQRQLRFRMRGADGTVRPVELRYRKPPDASRGADPDTAQVGVIRDITELERARGEYQSLVDSLADVAYTLDVETGKFTFVNASASDFFGISPEAFIGTSFLEHIAPESLDQVRGTTMRPYKDGDKGTFARFKMIAANNRTRTVEVRARRRLNEQGRLVSTGVIRDVEEQVLLEARLKQDMTRLQSIVESGGALIVLVDRNLDMTMVNSGFTALTGIAAADAVGLPLYSVLDVPLDPERTERSRLAVKMRDRDGRERLIAVTATPVTDTEGVVTSILLLGVDDTERREAEQALYSAERFATVGEMAGTMAHEISQPLQVINLSCELAREELSTLEPAGKVADVKAFVDSKLQRIAQQVETASRIIGDLRAYVRGTTNEAPGPFDANEAVQRAIDMTDHGVREAGMNFAVRMAADLPAVVGDVGRLEQVLVNLVNNARDAGGRRVSIATDTMHDGDRTYVRIAVEDTGPGIPADILPQLFHAFVTTKPRGKGTGLGLRICKRILEEMGGRISAGNLPEGGARFEILLPANEG